MTTNQTPKALSAEELVISEKDLHWWIKHLKALPEDEKVAFMRIAPAVCDMALKSLQIEAEIKAALELIRRKDEALKYYVDNEGAWVGGPLSGETAQAALDLTLPASSPQLVRDWEDRERVIGADAALGKTNRFSSYTVGECKRQAAAIVQQLRNQEG